jgi:DNA-binding MarR family transcriptional regulator
MSDDEKRTEALGMILELALMLNSDMSASAARDGLTTSRTRVLWELKWHGPVRQRELADSLGVAPRTVTGLVDGLVDTGFVTRESHPADRRAILVTLTPHGEHMVKSLEREQHTLAGMLFGGMPPKRFECFLSGLSDVLARLREQGLSAAIPEGAT